MGRECAGETMRRQRRKLRVPKVRAVLAHRHNDMMASPTGSLDHTHLTTPTRSHPSCHIHSLALTQPRPLAHTSADHTHLTTLAHHRYCDGGSFSGFRSGPVPAPAPRGSGKPTVALHFRGLRNFDATIEWALTHGLDRASEVVLTGISAGGVAAMVHADRLAARVSPTCR